MGEPDLDPSLQWTDAVAVADEIPLNNQRMIYSASSSTAASTIWHIEPPSPNSLMDTDVWIEWDMHFTSINAAENQADNGLALNEFFNAMFENHEIYSDIARTPIKVCPRPGFSMNRTIINASVNINGTVVSTQPQRWNDAFNRIYMTKEDMDYIGTVSGGPFDSGVYHKGDIEDNNKYLGVNIGTPAIANDADLEISLVPDSFGNVAVPTDAAVMRVDMVPNFPKNEIYANQGFTKRFHMFAARARNYHSYASVAGTADYLDNQAVIVNRTYPSDFRFSIWERLPLPPFLFYENRDYRHSIPNVRTMDITLQMDSNWLPLFFQGNVGLDNATASGLFAATWYPVGNGGANSAVYPRMHIRWVIPKHTFPIPPSVSIPMYRTSEYFTNIGTIPVATTQIEGVGGTNYQDVNYNNLRLDQIPDLMVIFCKPVSPHISDSSDHNLEINKISIDVDGQNSKLLQAAAPQLYLMFIKNSEYESRTKVSFEEWKRCCCVVPITPADLGLTYGPGFELPLTLNITVGVRNNWVTPASNTLVSRFRDDDDGIGDAVTPTPRAYNLHVICLWERYALTLNANGGSKQEMTRIPPSGIMPGAGQGLLSTF
jgi:hypothetical protein